MTARNAMTHRCTIQRDASHDARPAVWTPDSPILTPDGPVVGVDPRDEWGGDAAPQWDAIPTETTVPCRYWYDDSVSIQDGEKRILAATRYLQLPIDTDVTDDDRILVVTDRRGRVLAQGPMRIDSLGAHERDHLVAKLVAIT